MLKLQYTDGSQKGVWLIEPKQKLGSDRKNDLVMAAQDVGDFHAEIHVSGDNLRLEPLGGHACQVNGNRIAGATPIKLGDKIRIGTVELVVMDPRQQPRPAAGAGKPAAAKPAGPAANWALVAQQGGKRWTIKGTMVVGRAQDCAISIAYDRMSRKHAELKEKAGSLTLRDLGSANGTFVNDQRLQEAEVTLKPGDKVRFDMLAFIVEGPGVQEDINKTVVRPAIDLAAIQKQAKAAPKGPAKPARTAPARATAARAGEATAPQEGGSDATEATGNGMIWIVAGVVVLAIVAGAAWFFLR